MLVLCTLHSSVVICRTNINIFTRRDRPFLHISVFKRERARCLPHHYNCVFLALAYNKLILYTELFAFWRTRFVSNENQINVNMWHRMLSTIVRFVPSAAGSSQRTYTLAFTRFIIIITCGYICMYREGEARV